jgi:hypothetical protein
MNMLSMQGREGKSFFTNPLYQPTRAGLCRVSGEPIKTEAATQGTLICTTWTDRSHPAANVEYLLDPMAADRCRPPARRSFLAPSCLFAPHTYTYTHTETLHELLHSGENLRIAYLATIRSRLSQPVDGTPRSSMQSRPLEPLSCMARTQFRYPSQSSSGAVLEPACRLHGLVLRLC